MKRIKDLPNIERPREKLIKYGTAKLSNEELLAIILGTGTKKENAVTLAKRILKIINNTATDISLTELRKIKGLGPAKATKIVACFELSSRLLGNKKANIYLSPKDIFNELKDIRKAKKEHFVVFYLDSKNQEIKNEIISIGNLNSAVVHPREVFEPAVKNVAAQIVVAHNHPTGDLKPSYEDIDITNSLKQAGDILGIELTDHIIVSQNSYYSFKENGLI